MDDITIIVAYLNIEQKQETPNQSQQETPVNSSAAAQNQNQQNKLMNVRESNV